MTNTRKTVGFRNKDGQHTIEGVDKMNQQLIERSVKQKDVPTKSPTESQGVQSFEPTETDNSEEHD